MTAGELHAIGSQAADDLALVQGTTEQILLRGIVAAAETFDYSAPLPPMRTHGADPSHSWEPAARHYRDINDTKNALEPTQKADSK